MKENEEERKAWSGGKRQGNELDEQGNEEGSGKLSAFSLVKGSGIGESDERGGAESGNESEIQILIDVCDEEIENADGGKGSDAKKNDEEIGIGAKKNGAEIGIESDAQDEGNSFGELGFCSCFDFCCHFFLSLCFHFCSSSSLDFCFRSDLCFGYGAFSFASCERASNDHVLQSELGELSRSAPGHQCDELRPQQQTLEEIG